MGCRAAAMNPVCRRAPPPAMGGREASPPGRGSTSVLGAGTPLDARDGLLASAGRRGDPETPWLVHASHRRFPLRPTGDTAIAGKLNPF